MKRELPPQEYQRLSEYLDGQLSAVEAAHLETRLKTESDLREELDALRVTRQMLRSAPKRRAPRSFALTPEMVAKARPAGAIRWFNTFRFASALAALLLVAVFVGDLALSGRATNAAQPQPVSMESSASEDTGARTFNQDEPFGGVPPLVTWGTPTPDFSGGVVGMGGAAGMGGGGGGATGELQPGPIVEMTLPPTQEAPAAVAAAPQLTQATAEPGPASEMQKSAPPTEAAGIAGAQPEDSLAKEPVASGPILGVAAGTPYPTVTPVAVATPARSLLGDRPGLRAAEIALAVVAIAAGLAAFYLARKPAA